MTTCPNCNTAIPENDSFCTVCGFCVQDTSNDTAPKTQSPKMAEQNLQASTENEVEPVKTPENEVEPVKTPVSKTGYLVFPDGSKIEVDESQRLVGRADLTKFLDDEQNKISRGHFTVFKENGKYYIHDGSTNVQDKPSESHTFLNDEDITEKGTVELSDGNIIKLLEVEIIFKLG